MLDTWEYLDMIEASCHCGKVKIRIPNSTETVTEQQSDESLEETSENTIDEVESAENKQLQAMASEPEQREVEIAGEKVVIQNSDFLTVYFGSNSSFRDN